jgi:hypothetical protein
MKTSTHTRIRAASLLALGILITGTALAATEGEGRQKRERSGRDEERGEQHPWREEAQAFHKAQREKIRTYMEAQHEAGKEFRETVRDVEDPYEAVKMIKAHRVERHKKNTKFYGGIHSDTLEFLKAMFAKYDVSEEKQNEILAKVEGHHSDRVAEHEERYAKVIDVLDSLAVKKDLTKENIRDAMKELHGDRPRRGRDGCEGRGKGKGDKGKGRRRGGDED